MTDRCLYVDSIKAIAIESVIIGHFYGLIFNESNSFVYKVIYSFHMPVFFYISGLFLKDLVSNTEYYIRVLLKARQLLVPYFVFGFICSFYLRAKHWDVELIYGGYWFLKSLFLCFLYSLTTIAICNQFKICRKWILVVPIIFYFLYKCRLNFGIFPLHYFLFILGFLSKTYMYRISISFIFLFFLLLLDILLIFKFGIINQNYITYTINVLSVFIIFCFFKKTNLSNPILNLLGRNTLGIYVYHYFFLYSMDWSWILRILNMDAYWMRKITFFSVLIFISLVISIFCILCSKLTSFLLNFLRLAQMKLVNF